jgi:hypothetical protein
VTRISGTHHILGIKDLLSELGNSQRAVLLTSTACQWSVPNHEEVQTREWNHVYGELTEIAIELARKSKTTRCPAHSGGNEMVQVTICGCGELEGSEANVVQCLVVKSKALIGILN